MGNGSKTPPGEWRPEWRGTKERPPTVNSRNRGQRLRTQGMERPGVEYQKKLGLLRVVAMDAMKAAKPMPSREELREVCVRGLLAIAENEDADFRARAVCYKAVLDHTDKIADREEDYSKMTDPELRDRIVAHARRVIEMSGHPQLPESTGEESPNQEP